MKENQLLAAIFAAGLVGSVSVSQAQISGVGWDNFSGDATPANAAGLGAQLTLSGGGAEFLEGGGLG